MQVEAGSRDSLQVRKRDEQCLHLGTRPAGVGPRGRRLCLLSPGGGWLVPQEGGGSPKLKGLCSSPPTGTNQDHPSQRNQMPCRAVQGELLPWRSVQLSFSSGHFRHWTNVSQTLPRAGSELCPCSLFFFNLKKIFYLFLAALILRCCTGFL